MKNILLVAILLIIAGSAVWYIYKAKKSGATCIGCPHSKNCGSSSCNCNSKKDL